MQPIQAKAKWVSHVKLSFFLFKVNVMGDHKKIIRKVGAASNVLLKNSNNVLPLNRSLSNLYSIGLFGSDAGLPVNGPNGCPDHGCDDGTLAQGWGSGTTNFPYLISVRCHSNQISYF
jgi:beta-glucosidase-like glycosyl hydrolase